MNGISIEKAPEKGFILAYFRKRLIFTRYEKKGGELVFDGQQTLRDEAPWECHLFDENTEYRSIARQARGDRVESVLTARDEKDMDPDLLYAENVLVREEYRQGGAMPEKLTVVNRYRYSDSDTLVLGNYRLSARP